MTPDGALDAAFAAQPRTGFLPRAVRDLAAADRPLAIGHGQTNSQPSTMRAMLALLDVRRGQRVLDVGAGSGWTTALLAELVGPSGWVLGVERVPALVELGARHVADAGVPWAQVRQARAGVLGSAGDAPFDRVLVSAASSHLPRVLVDQLAPGGVLVIPVAGVMTRVERGLGEDELTVTEHGRYRFVPLVTD